MWERERVGMREQHRSRTQILSLKDTGARLCVRTVLLARRSCVLIPRINKYMRQLATWMRNWRLCNLTAGSYLLESSYNQTEEVASRVAVAVVS